MQGGRNQLNATFCSTVAAKGDLGCVHVMNYSFIASLFNVYIGREAVNVDSVVDQIISDGVWDGYKLNGVETLQLQRQHNQMFDPYSLLFLQSVGFITKVLYPARTTTTTKPF